MPTGTRGGAWLGRAIPHPSHVPSHPPPPQLPVGWAQSISLLCILLSSGQVIQQDHMAGMQFDMGDRSSLSPPALSVYVRVRARVCARVRVRVCVCVCVFL